MGARPRIIQEVEFGSARRADAHSAFRVETMQQQPESKERKVVWIGPDQVTITGEEVVIEARHQMPDWRVRDSDNIPICFEDKNTSSRKRARVNCHFRSATFFSPGPKAGR